MHVAVRFVDGTHLHCLILSTYYAFDRSSTDLHVVIVFLEIHP